MSNTKSDNCRKVLLHFGLIVMLFAESSYAALTEKQFQQSLGVIRKGCLKQTGADPDIVDGLKKGIFREDNKELKCYTLCVAQTTGTMTRKNVYSEQKVLTQIDILLPVERRAPTTNSWHACKHIQDGYKDPCDRTFFSIKCVYEFAPSEFAYP